MQQKTNSDLSRHYLPRQLRHLILQEYLSGVKTARQLSEEHGIPMSTIHKMGQRWKAKNSCSFVSTPNPYPIMSRVTSEEASELLSENKALRRRLEEALLRLEGYEIMGDILQEEYGIDAKTNPRCGLERSGADIGTEVFHPVVSCSMKGRFSYCVHYPDINCMK